MAEANGTRGTGASRPAGTGPDGSADGRTDGVLVRRAGGAHRLDVRGAAAVDVSGWDGSEPLLSQPPILERDGQTALVRQLIEDLCNHARAHSGAAPTAEPGPGTQPPGELLVIEGQAGWGKTMLLDEVRKIAVEQKCTVLTARGAAREQTRSFWVVRQLFYNLLFGYAPETRSELLGEWHDIIAPALGLSPATSGQTPQPFGVYDGLDYLMTKLTRHRGPIVVVVDDVHWADAESLAWLVGFARNLERWPVLVVAARRTEEESDAEDLLRDLATVDRVRRLTVGLLSPAAVGQMVDDALGPHADDVFKARCHEVTGGSPFVTWAMLGEVKRRNLAPTAENSPQLAMIAATQVGEKLALRLDSLGNSFMDVARAVAVLGTEATIGRVAALAEVDIDKAAQIADRLRSRAILLDGDCLTFVHPLIAAAVYQWIQQGARSALHARAARLLVRDGCDPRSVAVHLLRTDRCGDHWVVNQLRIAAEQDKYAGAPASAVRCLQRALAEPPFPEDRAAVKFELGRAAFVNGDPYAAITHLRGALTDDAGDRVLREQIVLQLARALGYTDQIKEAVELLDSEAGAANASSTKLRLQAEHFLWAAFWNADPDNPTRARRLRSLVLRLGPNGRTERSLLALRAWYGVVSGDPMVQVIDCADQACGPGLTWTDEDWGFEIPSLLALVYMYCDKNQKAEDLFTEGIDELRRHGWQGFHMAYAYSMRGFVRFRQGKLELAEQDCRDGLRLALRLGLDAPARWYALAPLIQILIARGRVQEAAELAEQYAFREEFPSAVVFPDPQAVRGELRLALRQYESAAADLTEAGARLEGRGVKNPAWCGWQAKLAYALSGADPEAAHRHAADALKRAYRFGAPTAMGQALRISGWLEGGQKGLAKLEEAVMWLQPSDARYEYASALIEYGQALRSEHGDRDAADPLFDGLTVAVECGADVLANMARAELMEMGELAPPQFFLDGGAGDRR